MKHRLPKPLKALARGVELDDGREVRADTGAFSAPLERPDVAVAVSLDPDGRPPLPTFRELGPALFNAIRIVLRVCLRREHRHRDDGCDETEDHPICTAHDSALPSIVVIACRYLRCEDKP